MMGLGPIKNLLPALGNKQQASNESNAKARDQRSWPEPKPLRNEQPTVVQLSKDMLPGMLSKYVFDVAERISAPVDFVAVSVVVGLSSIIGRRCGILPKKHDNWLVVPNLWGMLIGAPSSRKTPSLAAVRNILSVFELGERQSCKSRGEKPVKRFYVNDLTVQSLIQILQDNPQGILFFRDELRGFFEQLNQPSNASDRAFYLEAWNASGAYQYDTIKHGNIYCEAPCISILGGIQPKALASMLEIWERKGVSEDGLMQRMQLMVYPQAQAYEHVDRVPDFCAKEQCEKLFRSLVDYSFVKTDPSHSMPALRFDSSAQDAFSSWVEATLRRAGEDSSPFHSHIGKYDNLMASLSLIFYLAETVGNIRQPIAVDLPSTEKAVMWCDYLESHAKRIYSLNSAPRSSDKANRLLQALLDGRLGSPFTIRDLAKKNWSELNTTPLAEEAVQVLIQHHYLAEDSSPSSVNGGRPTVRYVLNPRAFKS